MMDWIHSGPVSDNAGYMMDPQSLSRLLKRSNPGIRLLKRADEEVEDEGQIDEGENLTSDF